jgi:hypothetical protein
MPGIRVDRLLTSTAVALLLAAAAGGALADPSSVSSDKPVSAAPRCGGAAGRPGQSDAGRPFGGDGQHAFRFRH